ncbi:MAG TPA: hypothetical protein VMM18_04685 [Gemmatimonadaceae bacterium]|nr:hypothetical protein [Gemmatimonadaceae bacterium]
MALRRRELFLAAQILFGAAVLGFAGVAIAGQWGELRAQQITIEPHWGALALSALLVLAAYALLIQTWRLALASWGMTLSFPVASRIWFVSNLGRYIPGRIWQIGALAMMAQRRGISPVAATGASILVNLVSVLVGIAIVFAMGARVLELPAIALVAVTLAAVGTAAAPLLVPRLVTLVGGLAGKPMPAITLPARAVWLSGLGTGLAWLLYGTAFQLLVLGTTGSAAGAWTDYVAVFVASYLAGYLALIVPDGLLVREAVIVAGLTELGLANVADALAIAVASRLWLTVLQVLPGVGFLLRPQKDQRLSDPMGDASSG